ncbi:hypothetical protein PHYC_00221 [Phycisphaerales bacterium]|nr:hypothetical protein PHYC_00221 [Phycisphaerales bacterium]
MRIMLIAALAGIAVSLPSMAQSRPAVKSSSLASPGVLGADLLPIRRITLYRSGVGSFQRLGEVNGDATIQLRFKTEQINDILKSMVAVDLSKGKGRIDGIAYASKEPLAKRLASFGVDISDSPKMRDILSRLRGSPVKVTTSQGEFSGTVLNVEDRPTIVTGGQDAPPARHDLPWVNLLTPQGVKSVSLTEALGFAILDPGLAEELAKALAAVAEYRADRTKTVDIVCSGDGSREIALAYVQESPVWKATYRLILPKTGGEGAEKAPMQMHAWAIVENTSDDDWKDVTLALVSGRPVSFRMDLYEPLFMTRPELPVPTEQGVVARVFDAGQSPFRDAAAPAREEALRALEFDARTSRMRAAAPGRPSGGAEKAADPSVGYSMTGLSGDDMTTGFAAQSRGVESGEVFQFEVDHPVTVERQRSAMIPIVDTGIEGRRVSIYTPGDNPEHPMRGVEITNTSDVPFMPGPISVYDDGTYAGDAQIMYVPKGDKRLLAYSLDLEVDADAKSTSAYTVQRIKIVKGAMEQTALLERATTYSFENKDGSRPRTILIEHPRDDAWEFVGDAKPVETTTAAVRFQIEVSKGGKKAVEVKQRRIEGSRFEVTSFDLATLLSYSKQGKVSEEVLAAVREAARRQGVIADLALAIGALEKERAEITSDQSRVRENIGSVDRTSDLYARYMRKLSDQETRLDAIVGELATAHANLTAAQQDLASYISGLNVE